MKTLASLAVLAASAALVYQQRPPTLTPARGSDAPLVERTATVNDRAPVGSLQRRGLNAGAAVAVPTVQLESNVARKFEVTIQQVVPGGAIGHGCFYDVPASDSTTPERLDWRDRHWTQAGTIFIAGVSGVVDKQEWRGWLVREGTQSYSTLFGGTKTVPSYRLVGEPAPVNKPGGWMNRHGRTALDR